MWLQSCLSLFAACGGICHTQLIANSYQQPLSTLEDDTDALSSSPLLALHRDLVQIESISGNEHEVGQYLTKYLHKRGFNVEAQPVPSASNSSPDAKPRYNIYAYRGHERNTNIVLTSHIDTVPPFIPYSVDHATGGGFKNTTIHGRGSADAKASVAAQIVTAISLLDPSQPSYTADTPESVEPLAAHTLGLLFVVGEEIGGDGMRTANDLDISPDALIFGEPTDNRLVAGHKGLLEMTVTARGMAAHSGYPWLGISANSVLVRAMMGIEELVFRSGTVDLAEGSRKGDWDEHGEVGRSEKPTLPRSKKYGVTTVNLGKVEGGVAENVIAEVAHAGYAIRIAAGTPTDTKKVLEQTVHDSTKEILAQAKKDGKIAGIEITYATEGYGPVGTNTDIDGFEAPITVNYGTDVPNWTSGGKRYLYGPGSILVAHGPHEKITVGDLEQAVVDYRRMILGVLKKLEEEGKVYR